MRRSTAKLLTLLIVVVMVVALIVCEIAGWNDALFLFELACLMVLGGVVTISALSQLRPSARKGRILLRVLPLLR